MNEHKNTPHAHDHGQDRKIATVPQSPVPLMPDDAGSHALSDTLQSSFLVVKILMLVLVVGFFLSGMFTVGPQERAIILRFGKPVGAGEAALLGPGFHWAYPAPIDEVQKIPFSQVQVASSTIGWYATTAVQEASKTEPPPRPTLNPALDSYVLTSDANIIHVRASLRYRIVDPIHYIFAFGNAADFVTNALNNALLFAASQFTVDDALTRNVAAFHERVSARISQLAEHQHLGIAVEQVALTSLIPPRQLADNFRAVLDASVRREQVLNEARSFTNQALSRAQGEAATRTAGAQIDRTRLIRAVESEAQRFSEVLPQYRENPDLFMRLRLAETWQRVLTNAQERIFLPDRADGKSRELRLQLGPEPLKRKPAPEPQKEDRH